MLPQKLPIELMQTQWAAQLNPLVANPLNKISVLENINLVIGTNVINHFLGKTMQGWFLADIQGASVVYRNAPFNNLTLSLSSSAAVSVNIGVF